MNAHHIQLDSDEMEAFNESGQTIAQIVPVESDNMKALIFNADESSPDGRSPWCWIRLANGDLIFGCFPQGDTYMETELADERP